ncbi:MAG: hypothetical protein GF418_14435 [Chitinivibrionales bacterium]|nr:hypothetical protein [Chitinivibrionales bacterium]MBD3396818.1 hypothetical protein [Chitinivibrionales bacterium]
MADEKDPLSLKKNFTAFALFLLVVLVAIDVVLRVAPGAIKPDVKKPCISAVGHHHEFDDGSSYYIYTIFESNGDVYQCWWNQEQWNQKKVTNYRGPTMPVNEAQ